MAENTEPTIDETEVEAHSESILPLQGISPADPGFSIDEKSTVSGVC